MRYFCFISTKVSGISESAIVIFLIILLDNIKNIQKVFKFKNNSLLLYLISLLSLLGSATSGSPVKVL